MLLIAFVFIVIGIVLLGFAADRFITSSVAIAAHFNISPMLIGVLLVGFGTSFPEVVVSVIAALKGDAAMSVGNVIGSNIANIGLCLGVTSILVPLTVHSKFLKRDYWLMLFFTLLMGLFVYLNVLNRVVGVILLVVLAAYLCWMIYSERRCPRNDDAMSLEYKKEIPTIAMRLSVASMWWFFSLVLILCSAELLVRGAIIVAQWFQVSSLIIGLTIVAIGTSLPELAATIIAAKKGEDDIAVGNVIGSCIFNLLAVLAMPALISPGRFSAQVLYRDYPIMLLFTVAMWMLIMMPPKKGQLGRLSGFLLLSAFIVYIILLVVFR